MAILFVDSSALVKRYRQEEGSQRVSELLNQAHALIAARLTLVEVSSAIVRRGRATGMSTQDLEPVLSRVDADLHDSFDVVEMNAPVIERAVSLTRQHGRRAADAIQLACALLARDESPQEELSFMASDQELNVAAATEGLSVIDPTQPV